MENNKHFPNYITRAFIALFLAVLISSNSLIGANLFQDQVQQIDNEYVEFSGTVEDIQIDIEASLFNFVFRFLQAL